VSVEVRCLERVPGQAKSHHFRMGGGIVVPLFLVAGLSNDDPGAINNEGGNRNIAGVKCFSGNVQGVAHEVVVGHHEPHLIQLHETCAER
jgi:hypothetical protein